MLVSKNAAKQIDRQAVLKSLPPFTPKKPKYYCSCGCDHVAVKGSSPDGDLVRWQLCGCPRHTEHQLMTEKPANFRGEGVILTH